MTTKDNVEGSVLPLDPRPRIKNHCTCQNVALTRSQVPCPYTNTKNKERKKHAYTKSYIFSFKRINKTDSEGSQLLSF